MIRKILLVLSIISVIIFYIRKQRDKFPIVLAKKPNHDGFACLKMILEYHNKKTDMSILADLLFDENGERISLLQIVDAVETLDFNALAIQVPFDQFEEAPLPAIVHFNKNNFVVVYKITFRDVWVADPKVGKVQYSKEEFCKYWAVHPNNKTLEGVALLLE